MAIHPVFHSSLLALDPNDPLPGQEFSKPPPVPDKDDQEYEVDEVLDVRRVRGQLKARIKWTGWPEDLEWYPIENLENTPEKLQDFYRANPAKPRPGWLQQYLVT